MVGDKAWAGLLFKVDLLKQAENSQFIYLYSHHDLLIR